MVFSTRDMMTSKIITNKKIWERFVDAHAHDALFQRWEWGDVCEHEHDRLFRLGFFRDAMLVGIAQCIVVKAKRGNFLHVRHGPILSTWDRNIFSSVLRKLYDIAENEKCVAVRISPRIQDTPAMRTLFRKNHGTRAAIHAMDAECAWVLDIRPTEEDLLANMRKTTRYEIRKAIKMGVKIDISQEITSLPVFTSLYATTAKRHRFVKHRGIESEFEVYAKNNHAIMVTGSYEGKPIASAIILISGGQAIYHHGASVPSAIPVSYLVQWEAILYAKKIGLKEYNFWGIAPDGEVTHPWFGLSSFKKGFGGREVQTIHAYDFPISIRYWLLYVIEWLRKQKKGYS